jgi:hypothetical protein
MHDLNSGIRIDHWHPETWTLSLHECGRLEVGDGNLGD